MKIQAYLFLDKRKCKEVEIEANEIPEEVCLSAKNLVDKKIPLELVFKKRPKGIIHNRNLAVYMVAYDFKGVRPK